MCAIVKRKDKDWKRKAIGYSSAIVQWPKNSWSIQNNDPKSINLLINYNIYNFKNQLDYESKITW